MKNIDNIVAQNQQEWEDNVASADQYTIPWLDLDMDAVRDFAEGRLSGFHEPSGPIDIPMLRTIRRLLYGNLKGKKVLCLASGGGQQSAVFALLGADVTVADISQGQLNGDLKAARHYGYEIKTVQCSMMDLSMFEPETFDIVYQPVSIVFVPDVLPVYEQVYRVLKSGGLYSVGHINPSTYPVDFDNGIDGWDGTGYRIATPYLGGALRVDANGNENMTDGEPVGEFRHLFIDMFCGLTQAGFTIRYVSEEPRNFVRSEGPFSVVQKYIDILSVK
ncbi:MAG: class I SAM-dependent methyltransferase [Oscillospiraceae bacterium]|nr:class I SAM-dependent methyltransferase [Oscillospiraceae bacterium]